MPGTKFPNIIPIAIAKKINKARKRSRIPRLLNAEVFVVEVHSEVGGVMACFSMSGSFLDCGYSDDVVVGGGRPLG